MFIEKANYSLSKIEIMILSNSCNNRKTFAFLRKSSGFFFSMNEFFLTSVAFCECVCGATDYLGRVANCVMLTKYRRLLLSGFMHLIFATVWMELLIFRLIGSVLANFYCWDFLLASKKWNVIVCCHSYQDWKRVSE